MEGDSLLARQPADRVENELNVIGCRVVRRQFQPKGSGDVAEKPGDVDRLGRGLDPPPPGAGAAGLSTRHS